MKQDRAFIAGLWVLGLLACAPAFATELSIGHEYVPGSVKIVLGKTVADIYVDAKDSKLAAIAAGLLADDVQRVTGKRPRVVCSAMFGLSRSRKSELTAFRIAAWVRPRVSF